MKKHISKIVKMVLEGDNMDRLAEIIEIKHRDLVDNMKLMCMLLDDKKASDIQQFIEDAWKVYELSIELTGMISSYKIVVGIADVKPEIRDIEENILCYHDILKGNLKKVAIKYVESERDFRKWRIVSGQK